MTPPPHDGLGGAGSTGSQRIRQPPSGSRQVKLEPDRHPVALQHPVLLPAEVEVEVTPKRALGGVERRLHPVREMSSIITGRLRRGGGVRIPGYFHVRVVIVVVSVSLHALLHVVESQKLGDFVAVPRQTSAV